MLHTLLQPMFSALGFTYSFFVLTEQNRNGIILLEDSSRLIGE